MSPTRLQREGRSLAEVQEAVRTEFGPAARIVAAERVTTGGLGGLFRKHHIEATVELPSSPADAVARVSIQTDGVRRAGILALLDDADAAETRLAAGGGAASVVSLPSPSPSSSSSRLSSSSSHPSSEPADGARSTSFASVMDDFASQGISPAAASSDRDGAPVPQYRRGGATAGAAPVPLAASTVDGPAAGTVGPASPLAASADALAAVLGAASASQAAAPPVGTLATPTDAFGVVDASVGPIAPPVSTAAGDLVLVVGRAEDAAATASLLSFVRGLSLVDVPDRRAAILARAAGVQEERATVSAMTWSSDAGAGAGAGVALRAIGADQVWAVVDAGRKHDDTVRWVRALAAAATAPLTGVIAVGSDETATASTVHMLGLPVLDARELGGR